MDEKIIIVAEDDFINYKLLEKIVKKDLGLLTCQAVNGQEAVQMALEKDNIAIVLMDINMPTMSGYKATEEIKKVKPNLPIIAVTAYAMTGDREKSLSHGCDEYVSKPIDHQELIEKIKRLML
jgi:CheY-like chemotaxis protein